MYNGKVAIVDDEPLLIRIITDLLKRSGIDAEAFSSGSDALNKIIPNISKYSCIITDFDMPGGLSGIELAAKIREVSFDLPIIISSGDKNLLDENDLIKYRIKSVLKKPFTKNELFRILKGVIDIPIHSR